MLRKLLLAVVISLFGSPAIADETHPVNGGGITQSDFRDHLTPEQRAVILQKLAVNRRSLRNQGVLLTDSALAEAQAAHPLFDWPTAPATSDPGYFGISNFVDHDSAFPDSLEDYMVENGQ